MTRQSRWRSLLLLAGLCAFVLTPSPGLPQVIATADETDTATTDKSPGFSLHKEQRPVSDAFDDFERYRDKKAWEKAFSAISKVADGAPGRLVPDKDGFYVPTRLKVRAELLSLPAEGREAYRLFNNAKATQLLRDIGTGDDVQSLRKIIDRYFITSVGDQAADRLGDALFEAGDFANAERCWRMILDSFPDTSLSPALLQTKRAIAFVRAGDTDQFNAVRAAIKDRYAGQTVRIGGRDLVAVDFVDGLRPAASPTPANIGDPGIGSDSTFVHQLPADPAFALPTTDTPAWQIPLMDADASKQLNTQLNQLGWGAMAVQFGDVVPTTAVDAKRIYVNWLGVCFAADLKTGKLLWRTDTFGDMPQKIQQTISQGRTIDPAVYSTTLIGDKILFTRRSTDSQNYNELPMGRLMCLATATGKVFWKSESAISDWGVLGEPLVSGDVLYIIGHPTNSQELSLLCLGMDHCNLRWTLSLGTPAASTDYRGVPSVPQPTLLKRRDKLDVLTNNGVLLEIDLTSRQIDWAFTHPTNVKPPPQYYNGTPPETSPCAPGAMLAAGSTLYFKEYNNRLLFALDLSEPAIKWKRPIDPDAGVARFDGHNLVLIGTEVECVDLESRGLQWDDKLSLGTGSINPLLLGDQLYVFGARGIHQVQLTDGRSDLRFRGFDHDSGGGRLWKTADRLVTVSSRAITAYAVPTPAGKSER